MRLIRRFNTILVTAVIITCGCLYNWCVCDPGYRFLGSCYMCAAAKGDTGDNIVSVDDQLEMLGCLKEALIKHKRSISVYYPGIDKDFADYRRRNYIDLFDLLNEYCGYYYGVLSGVCITINNKEYVEFQFNYLTTKKQERYINANVRKLAKEYKGKSRYCKIKGIHDYLVCSIRYDRNYYNPYYAFKKGRGICMSYALAFQRIMQEMKIPCMYVKGKDHAWNMVKLKGKWYFVDVTWDDSFGGYKYFLKGTSDFSGHNIPKTLSIKRLKKARYAYGS